MNWEHELARIAGTDQAQAAQQILAQLISNYYQALKAVGLPTPLIHRLISDYQRLLLQPKPPQGPAK